MKKLLVVALSILLTVVSVRILQAAQFDTIISAADVEKATGLSGVKQVPRDRKNKFKNGDINFVTSSDQPLLMVEFRPAFVYEAMKSDSGYFKAAVPGIGEDAFSSPAFDPQFSVNVLKGGHVAVVTTHIDPKDRKSTMLRMDALIGLAKLVASRM